MMAQKTAIKAITRKYLRLSFMAEVPWEAGLFPQWN